MRDLVSLGELLVDFTPVGESAAGNPVFERNPGGGPGQPGLRGGPPGVNTAFIGQVGDDAFGRALKGILADNRVDVGRLRLSADYQTTLAFVHLDAGGERSFSFYRRQGADTMLVPEEADFALAADCPVLFLQLGAHDRRPLPPGELSAGISCPGAGGRYGLRSQSPSEPLGQPGGGPVGHSLGHAMGRYRQGV